MAVLTRSAKQVSLTKDLFGSETFEVIAGAAIEEGQPVYVTSSGKLAVADASAAASAQAAGVALNKGQPGDAITVVKRGPMEGWDLSTADYWDAVYLSETAGELEDSATTTTGAVDVIVGRVMPTSADAATVQKVLYVDFDYTTIFA